MRRLLFIVAFAGCKDKPAKSPPASPPSAAPAPIAANGSGAADPWKNPPPPPPPKPSAQLSTKRFDVTHVLGHSKAEVDKELGSHGEQLEDGPWLYDGFEHSAVTVSFEAGKAMSVDVQPPEYTGSDIDRAAVLAWMHAPAASDVDDHGGTEVEVWADGARARQQKRREAAKAITELMKSTGTGGWASANHAMLTFVPAPSDRSCSPAVLKELAKAFKSQLDDASFEVLECDVGGPKLKLR